jgi:chromate transporter
MNEVLFGPLGLGWADWLGMLAHFTALSLLAVGGAITTVAEMQRFVVEQQRWLTDTQFGACIALGQAAPGPNLLFVAVIGYSVMGLAGVAATLLGTLLPSTTLALAAGRWGQQHRESRGLRAFSTGMAPVTIGLLLATSWILLEPVAPQWRACLLVGVTVAVMLKTSVSPVWLIALGGVAGAIGWV